jgi:hypothetical protein
MITTRANSAYSSSACNWNTANCENYYTFAFSFNLRRYITAFRIEAAIPDFSKLPAMRVEVYANEPIVSIQTLYKVLIPNNVISFLASLRHFVC